MKATGFTDLYVRKKVCNYNSMVQTEQFAIY